MTLKTPQCILGKLPVECEGYPRVFIIGYYYSKQ